MIDGKTISMGGREWTIPPLNFKALRKFREQLGSMSAADLSRSDMVSEMILEAMRRNYPDLTLAELEDMLDMGNILPVVEAVLAASGLVQKEAASGEAVAASPLIGMNSTDS